MLRLSRNVAGQVAEARFDLILAGVSPGRAITWKTIARIRDLLAISRGPLGLASSHTTPVIPRNGAITIRLPGFASLPSPRGLSCIEFSCMVLRINHNATVIDAREGKVVGTKVADRGPAPTPTPDNPRAQGALIPGTFRVLIFGM